MEKLGDIGLIGLAVMGENLALNIERNGFPIAVFNRTTSKVDAFLETKAKGLGLLFIEEFEKSARQIGRFPDSGHRFGDRFQRVLMRRFPYALIYAASEDVVRIVAIMHQQRGPKSIRQRLALESRDGPSERG